jgi:hypothetical protein
MAIGANAFIRARGVNAICRFWTSDICAIFDVTLVYIDALTIFIHAKTGKTLAAIGSNGIHTLLLAARK